jgi:hypothetical protein
MLIIVLVVWGLAAPQRVGSFRWGLAASCGNVPCLGKVAGCLLSFSLHDGGLPASTSGLPLDLICALSPELFICLHLAGKLALAFLNASGLARG